MEGSNHGGQGQYNQYPPHPQPEPYPYPYQQHQQYPPPAAAPASHYLAPSTSFPAYSPAPPQQFAHHSGPLQPYPPPPASHQQQAYPPPPHPHQAYPPQDGYPPHPPQDGYPPPSPSPYGYDPYPAYPSYPSPAHASYPSPAISPSSSFHHQPHASAPESAAAASAPHYPIADVLSNMSLSNRYDHPPVAVSSPAVLPPSASFSSSHGGGGMQMVPYGAAIGVSQHGSVMASLKVVLLHGSLDIWVHEAKNLPNKDMFSKRVSDLIGPRLTSSLSSKKSNVSLTSDPYVTIQVSYATVGRTYVVSNNENPVWAQHFLLSVGHEAAQVEFIVKDDDVFGAQIMGSVAIPAENLLTGEMIEGVYPVLEPNFKPCAPGAVLRLSIQYIPVARLTMYHRGVIAEPECLGVPNTYFPLRRGMRVTLYQDAHVPDGCLPDIWLDHGLRYQHGQCWRDMYNAISQARRLIYIVGWSVFHTIHLIRDGAEKAPSLGELLKMKSQEGVRVLLLVWDDPTSRSILGFKTVCIVHRVQNCCLEVLKLHEQYNFCKLIIYNTTNALIVMYFRMLSCSDD